MAHTGGSLGGQCARLLCQGGVVKGELAGGLRVPGTAEVWGWKEEKQEDQDGPSGQGLLQEEGSESPFSSLVSPRSAPSFPEIPDERDACGKESDVP